MTVFVVNINKDDIADAKRWGDIRYVNVRYVYSDEIEDERIPQEFLNNMVRCAREFKQDSDFLLIQGDHLQLIQFATLLTQRFGWFRALRWERRELAYLPVRLGMLTELRDYGLPTIPAVLA